MQQHDISVSGIRDGADAPGRNAANRVERFFFPPGQP
jgi:hypothetical protein